MRSAQFSAFLLIGTLLAASAAAETRIFTVDGSDGYGVDRCLASGEPCGEAAASAICRARAFAKAVDFGRVDPNEITGAVPAGAGIPRCEGRDCPQTVAITCTR
jgi:hypothetical protein